MVKALSEVSDVFESNVYLTKTKSHLIMCAFITFLFWFDYIEWYWSKP